MSTRAYVQDDYARRGVQIHLIRHLTIDGREIAEVVGPCEPVLTRHDHEEGAAFDPQPFLRLPDDMARALLDALSAHYGGTTDVRTLRKDYDDERARVDKLIHHMMARANNEATR